MEDLFLKMNLLMIFVQNLTAAATIKKTTDLYVVELIVRRRKKREFQYSHDNKRSAETPSS